VASGGLDNAATIFKLPPKGGPAVISKPLTVLNQHEGYLSCCRFIGDDTLVTSSGDSTLLMWDIASGHAKRRFDGHHADVMSLSICPSNPATFVSGSCDTSARLWDSRIQNPCVMTYLGHEADVNSVRFMADGQAFVTVSLPC